MNQMTFSDMEYSGRKKITQKENFLQGMNEIIPWAAWIAMIQPYYPDGKRGRPTRGIEIMLRMYLLQNWFNLSDAGMCFVKRFSAKSEEKFRIFGSGIPFFRNGAWKQREVLFDPADLDRSRLAGWSVATATGGMGSEQKQAGDPPIA